MPIPESYAAMVALLGQFNTGRDAKSQNDFNQFLEWLVNTNHKDLYDLLLLNTKTTIAIKALLNQKSSACPVIDICKKGISVRELEINKLFFEIPYCAGKNTNAHNVNLMPAVFSFENYEYKIIQPFSDEFPPGITLTYETGKSMQFSLYPLAASKIFSLLIAVIGTYTNDIGSATYNIFDVFKFNSITNEWVRTMGKEDASAREFVLSTKNQ